jgi:hypothetical protein
MGFPLVVCGRVKVLPQNDDSDDIHELARLQQHTPLYVWGYDFTHVHVATPHMWGQRAVPVPLNCIAGVSYANRRSRVYRLLTRDLLSGRGDMVPGEKASAIYSASGALEPNTWNYAAERHAQMRRCVRNLHYENSVTLDDYRRWRAETLVTNPPTYLYSPEFMVLSVFYHRGVEINEIGLPRRTFLAPAALLHTHFHNLWATVRSPAMPTTGSSQINWDTAMETLELMYEHA